MRRVPHNFIFLLSWTLLESHIVSAIGLQYNMQVIASAMGSTAGVVLVVALLVSFTNFDFSKLLPIMSIVLFSLEIFGRFFMIFEARHMP